MRDGELLGLRTLVEDRAGLSKQFFVLRIQRLLGVNDDRNSRGAWIFFQHV